VTDPAFRTQIGEAFVGDGANATHVNTVLNPYFTPRRRA
jgi:formaldehyde-activating enzyme involved in methanogenesis